MQLKPGKDAVLVINVLARQLHCLCADLKRILANGALGFDITCDGILGDSNNRQSLHGRLRCRGRAVPVGIVFKKLLDEVLEPRAKDVIAHVSSQGDASPASVVEHDLDVCSAGENGLNMIADEEVRIETRGRGCWGCKRIKFEAEKAGKVTGVSDLDASGGGEERETGGGGEWRLEGPAGMEGEEGGGVRVGVRLGEVELLDEAAGTEGAGGVRGERGDDAHRPIALVAEVALRRGKGAGRGHGLRRRGVEAVGEQSGRRRGPGGDKQSEFGPQNGRQIQIGRAHV